jgi:hypothetical protein
MKKSFNISPLKIHPRLKVKSAKITRPEDSCAPKILDLEAFVDPKKVKYIKRNE